MYVATVASNRVRILLVVATLAVCAFLLAQGATALLAAKVKNPEADAVRPVPIKVTPSPGIDRRRDPTIILRRNIFDSALGDLSMAPMESAELPLDDVPTDEVENPCKGTLRLIATVVLPGDLERSLAAIVGTDQKAGLHRGGAEVEGSRILGIYSDHVVLRSSGGLCRLAMFEVAGAAQRPVPRLAPAARMTAKREAAQRGPSVDRNVGLTEEEIAQGVEQVNSTNFNLSRAMVNKVLDNAGKLIGIAAVAPKMEGGQSVGMEIRGVQTNTLLYKLGIRNGDILETVNGQALNNPDAALGAYSTLRTADKFNLSIRRGGQSMMINYNLQ
jgi:general secretion pathway protein C